MKFSMITWQAVEEALFDPTPPTEAKGEVQMNDNVGLAMMMMITTMMIMITMLMMLMFIYAPALGFRPGRQLAHRLS